MRTARIFYCKRGRGRYVPAVTPPQTPIKISLFGGIAAAACLALSTPASQAQDANSAATQGKAQKPLVIVSRQIDGKQMKFTSNGNWTRIEIEVKALPEGIKDALAAQNIPSQFNNASVRWLNNVKVTLVAGYQPTGGDAGKPKVMQDVLKLKDAVTGGKSLSEARNAALIENWRYYKASATILTLEVNTPRSVFFYIPADIVKRDNLSNPRPDVAYVTLEVDGKKVSVFDDKGSLYSGSFGVLFKGNTLGSRFPRLHSTR